MFEYKPFNMNNIKKAIRHARDCFPEESCGIISENKYIPFKNIHPNPEHDFLISSKVFNQLYIEGKIDCIIHSHNDYKHASKNDQIQQRNLEVPFGIINLKKGHFFDIFFFGDQLETAPLYERPFHFGVWDCLTYVRDYYKQELNVELPNPIREYNYWMKQEKMFEPYLETEPFYEIEPKDLKKNDLMLYKIAGRIFDHVGVHLGNGLVGHHFADRISAKYPSTLYRKNLIKCLRYNHSA